MKLQIKDNRLLNESGEQVGTTSPGKIDLNNDALRYEVIRQARIYRGRPIEGRSADEVREKGERIIKKELNSMEADRNRREDWEAHIIEQQKHILKLNSELEQLKSGQ
jgi:uncharacterized membrane protein